MREKFPKVWSIKSTVHSMEYNLINLFNLHVTNNTCLRLFLEAQDQFHPHVLQWLSCQILTIRLND